MISKEKILSVIKTIKEIAQTDEVYLFGSYATGSANEHSDLDVAVIKDDISDEYELDLNIRKKMLIDGYVPMDLVFLNKSQFETRKQSFGNIYHEVEKHGVKF